VACAARRSRAWASVLAVAGAKLLVFAIPSEYPHQFGLSKVKPLNSAVADGPSAPVFEPTISTHVRDMRIVLVRTRNDARECRRLWNPKTAWISLGNHSGFYGRWPEIVFDQHVRRPWFPAPQLEARKDPVLGLRVVVPFIPPNCLGVDLSPRETRFRTGTGHDGEWSQKL